MEDKINIDDISKNYDAYYIENKPGQSIPNYCYGAIGVTIDNDMATWKHAVLTAFANIASSYHQSESKDSYHDIDMTKIMHAFVVTAKSDESTLKVCEAVAEGITRSDIKIGDHDWTSMVLFVPKDVKKAHQIASNAIKEAEGSETKQVAEYAYFAGFVSLFAKKEFTQHEKNARIISKEMTAFLKSKNITNESGNPRETVCSQLALRILRASLLISEIPEEKVKKYELLDAKKLEEKLFKKLLNEDSNLAKAFKSSDLFNMPADIQALPHELYLALKRESDLH